MSQVLLRKNPAPPEGKAALLEQRIEDQGREFFSNSQRLESPHRYLTPIGLHHVQKLEAVGRLAPGIAHEISTPIQFAGDNVHFLREAWRDLVDILGLYRRLHQDRLTEEEANALRSKIQDAEERADLPYLEEIAPRAFEGAAEGMERVARIVTAMRSFCRIDRNRQKSRVDLNEAIRTVLTLARSEYKHVASVETDLGELPLVLGHPDDLSQVFLNLLVNAAQAIAEARKGDGLGHIRIETRAEADGVIVSIGDDGSGMPEEVRERIFDPSFTTKEAGRGTGRGLFVSRNLVVEEHGGELTFETEPGRGTTFFVRLPLEEASSDRRDGR